MSAVQNRGGRPFDKNSLRSQVRKAFMTLGLDASYEDVSNHVAKARSAAKQESYENGKDNLFVQVAQVRSILMKKCNIKIERRPGRPSKGDMVEITRQLALPSVQKRFEALRQAA